MYKIKTEEKHKQTFIKCLWLKVAQHLDIAVNKIKMMILTHFLPVFAQFCAFHLILVAKKQLSVA